MRQYMIYLIYIFKFSDCYDILATSVQCREWPGCWQVGCGIRAIESKVKNCATSRVAENETDVEGEDLPPPGGTGLLYDVDVEGGVDHLGELEEVGVGGVGGATAEDSLQKAGELSQGPRLIREDEVAVALDVHLVVEHDPPRLVVLVDDLCLDALDVLAVVVDVLLWCPPVLEDVVVVSVIDDQDASGLQHVVHVLDASLVVPEVTVVVDVEEPVLGGDAIGVLV